MTLEVNIKYIVLYMHSVINPFFMRLYFLQHLSITFLEMKCNIKYIIKDSKVELKFSMAIVSSSK